MTSNQIVTGLLLPSTAQETDRYQQRIITEQIRLIYRHIPYVVIGISIAVTLVVIAFFNQVAKGPLLLWASLIAINLMAMAGLYACYLRTDPAAEDIQKWGKWYAWSAFIRGCIYGWAGVFLFIPGSLIYQTLLTLLLCMLAMGAVRSLATYLPVFYAFVTPLVPPLAIRMLMENGTGHVITGISLMLLWATVLVLGRNFNSKLCESIRLKHENADLAQTLTEKQQLLAAQKEELAVQKEELLKQTHELTEQKLAAEQANMAKSKFLAVASHDLRQPMHALRLFVYTLKDRIQAQELRDIVFYMQNSVEAMEGLFNSLLDISKLDAGIIEPRFIDFPLDALLQRLVAEFEPQVVKKGIKLKLRRSHTSISSDPILLERILRNLISNAVKYTEHGGILVGARLRKEKLVIQVWDTGIGIPQDETEDIFEEFHQIDNVKRDRTKGLGLGLAIVDRLSRLLNHPIQVRSYFGRGSVFSLEVPLAHQAQEAVTPFVINQNSDEQVAGTFIVLIDDDVIALKGMQTTLLHWRCYVLAATSGEEAINKVQNHERFPDIIVSDYRLGSGETGTQVIVELRAKLGVHIPGIIISGDTSTEILRDVKQNGFMLLHKPVDPLKLKVTISELARRQSIALPEL